MTEQFSNLYTLPQALYVYGAPVLIADGELSKDERSGILFAQLSIRNLSEKTIRSAVISVTPCDVAGRPVGETIEKTYSDLHVKCGGSFGRVPAITFPDAYARSMTVSVPYVAFEDGSVWTPNGLPQEPLPVPETLQAHLNDDGELVRQYRLTYGETAQYFPMKEQDLWCCTCGAWNRADRCRACARSKEKLFDFDLFRLIDAKGVRVAKERAEAERRAAETALYLQEQKTKARRKRITIILACSLAVLLLAGFLIRTKYIVPNRTYEKAVALYESEQYEDAAVLFRSLDGFRSSHAYLIQCRDRTYGHKTIAGDMSHSFAIRTDGTAVVTGQVGISDYEFGQDAVSGWTDLVEISCGWDQTVGLKKNGKVVAVGGNAYGQCNVSGWSGIVSVEACDGYTMGLRSDGTVVTTDDSQPSDWKNVVAIDGFSYAFGLTSSGTVLAERHCGYDAVSEWRDVTAIAAGLYHVAALRSDGTVLAAFGTLDYDAENDYGQCDVSDWTDIVAIAAGVAHTVGLRSDGTVVAVGYNIAGQCNVSTWTDIVAIAAGGYHTIGLRSDGTVVTIGLGRMGQCNTFDWKDVRTPEQ